MWKQLDEIAEKYDELELKLQDPAVIQNRILYTETISQFSQIKTTAVLYKKYKSLKEDIQVHQEMMKEDQSLSSLVQEEIQSIEKELAKIELELKTCMQANKQDPLDSKNIILELRAGAGGDEAGLFCRELYEAYLKFAGFKNWKVELLSCSPLSTGGFREVIVRVSGKQVYSQFKYESGVHRVQRVPKTESQGRVHTSTVTVAVLPEAEEKELQIKQEDLRIDVCRSSGAGGQHVNTTDSAVRIVHLPTKLTVYCQEEKSQHANREKAFKILYARLLALQKEQKRKEESQTRLEQIGTGERSEKIRTYNFPQSRATDHRIAFSTHALDRVMKGEFDLLIEPIREQSQNNMSES